MIVAAETTNLLVCTLADEQYALPMSIVREVIRWRMPTSIPGTPQTLLGVIHHRGIVLPIIDVRPLLGLPAPLPTRNTRLIVVEQDAIHAGIVSDAVADIILIESAAIEPPPASLPGVQAQYLHGLVFSDAQPVALLNVAAIFSAITAAQDVG